MRVLEKLQFTNSPEMSLPKGLKNMFQQAWSQMVKVVNYNIGYGDGVNADNINGVWNTFVTPGAVNTDFTITHNLGRIPVGYHVMQKSASCDIYTGSVPATATQLTLRASAAGVTVKVFIV